MRPASIIQQKVVIKNTGTFSWPFDTYLVFAGDYNELDVAEEVYVGMLEPKKETVISFAIEAPEAK